jgi:hypothetical protein
MACWWASRKSRPRRVPVRVWLDVWVSEVYERVWQQVMQKSSSKVEEEVGAVIGRVELRDEGSRVSPAGKRRPRQEVLPGTYPVSEGQEVVEVCPCSQLEEVLWLLPGEPLDAARVVVRSYVHSGHAISLGSLSGDYA